MRLVRARIPAHYAQVFIDPAPSGRGITLKVGTTNLHLRPTVAIALANEIVDLIETQDRVNNIIQEDQK